MPKPPKPPTLLSRILNTEFSDYYSEFVRGGKVIQGGRTFFLHLSPQRKSNAARYYHAATRVHHIGNQAKKRPNLPQEEKIGKIVIEYEESEGIIWIACPKSERDMLSDALGIYSIVHTQVTIDRQTMIRVYLKDALKAHFQQ